MSIGVGLDNQDMDLKVFWTERLQVKPLLTLFHCRDKLEREQSPSHAVSRFRGKDSVSPWEMGGGLGNVQAGFRLC